MPADRTPTVGVLALQGAFDAHAEQLRALGVDTREVRIPEHLDGLDGLVLPGGESTTMSNLLVSSGLQQTIAELIAGGIPVFATCAGLILLATKVLDGRDDQIHFDALDVTVRRNGYGRQVQSFETDLDISGLDGSGLSGEAFELAEPERPFHGVFIRAPRIESVEESVEVLARHDGDPVLVRQGSIIAAGFHPELAGDARLHAAFVATIGDPTVPDRGER